MICKTSYFLLFLKTLIFISLAVVFYIFYFTDVARKFAERHTTVIHSQENINENERNPPFIIFCMTPRAKNSMLERHNLSNGFLIGPNLNDQKVLISLNETAESLYREVTFKLNEDFNLYINLWFYEDDDVWHNYGGKMNEGSNNHIKVCRHLTPKCTIKLRTVDLVTIAKRSQYINIKFPLNQSLNLWGCY